MSDKVLVTLESKPQKVKIIEHNGVEIEVTPFLSIGQQIRLVEEYMKDYFEADLESISGTVKYRFIGAEYNLVDYILQMVTNIDVDNLSPDFRVDTLFTEKILKEISNYNDFRYTLSNIVADRKEEIALENSLGKVISSLVEKGYSILENFSEISPESIEDAKKAGLQMISQLKESSILSEFKPEEKVPVTQKKSKSRKSNS